MIEEVPVVEEAWRPCYRVVPSRFPPVGLFDRVANPADLDAVLYVESLTNDRLREEVGALHLVPADERVSGPGTTPIMAAYTHLNPAGSRFSDGAYGVYYASREIETALRETIYHHEKFLRASHEKPIEVTMRAYVADLAAPLHDIRGKQKQFPQVYAAQSYATSQAFGAQLRNAKSWGVLYDSVRHPSGENVAVFRPRALSPCRQGRHFGLIWNGTSIADVIERKELEFVF